VGVRLALAEAVLDALPDADGVADLEVERLSKCESDGEESE
jgi:hypothetical protein